MDVHLEVISILLSSQQEQRLIMREQSLAQKHFDTRFLKMNVENAPFLVTKLKIQVLPCVISFIDGVSVDRIVGFEGLSYTPDTFTTKDLEGRLLTSGVIQRAKTTDNGVIRYGANAVRKEESD